VGAKPRFADKIKILRLHGARDKYHHIIETLDMSENKTDYSNSVVLIPAYNEEKDISQVINGIRQNVKDVDIIVVDDASDDRTAQLGDELGATVIRHPFNMGYGAALQTGFKYALENGYKYLVQIDADGQHDPSCIKRLFDEVIDNKNRTDLVIGSRFLENANYKTSILRRTGMLLFGAIASRLIGQRVTDSTSGFQAMNSRVLRFLSGEVYPADYPDADLIILLHYKGFKIKEAPIRMFPSKKKSMHSGWCVFYYVYKMLLSIFVTFLRDSKRRI